MTIAVRTGWGAAGGILRRGALVAMGVLALTVLVSPVNSNEAPDWPSCGLGQLIGTCISSDATTLFYNQPAASAFSGEFDRTYFGWTTTDGVVQATFLDHRTHALAEPVDVHRFDTADDHSAPSVLIPSRGPLRGHVLMFFSHHSSPMYMAASAEAESLVGLSESVRKIVDDPTTYPRAIELRDPEKLLVFFRGHPLEAPSSKGIYKLVESLDGGRTWNDPKTVVEFGEDTYVYAAPASGDGRSIAIAWSIFDRAGEDSRIRDVYFSSSSDGGSTWRVQGGDTDRAISSSEALQLASTPPDLQARAWDVAIIDNQVHVTFARYEADGPCCASSSSNSNFLGVEGHAVLPVNTSPLVYYANGLSFANVDGRNWLLGVQAEDDGGHGMVAYEFKPGSAATSEVEGGLSGLGSDRSMREVRPVATDSGLFVTWLEVLDYSLYRDFATDLHFAVIAPDTAIESEPG